MIPITDTIPSRTPPVVTISLIIVNAAVFVFQLLLPEPVLKSFIFTFGLVPARYTHPDWAVIFGLPLDDYWPFLTSMFLHGGFLHLLGNMWTLWIFGDNVEDRMGHLRFLLFYLLCGIAAGVTHVIMHPDSTIPTIGASGAISGVLGAYYVMFPLSRVVIMVPVFFLPIFFELPAILYLAYWALAQFFSGTLALLGPQDVGGVAWWAHLGGFVAGVAFHRFFLKSKRKYRYYYAPDEYGIEVAWR